MQETALPPRAQPFYLAVLAAPIPTTIIDVGDPDGGITFANDAFCRLTGYSREEFADHGLSRLHGPDTCPETVARLRAAIRAAKPIEILMRYYRKNGQGFWNRLLLAPKMDDDGRVQCVIANHIDVSTDKEKIESLESHNAVLAIFGENLTKNARELIKENNELKAEIAARDKLTRSPSTAH